MRRGVSLPEILIVTGIIALLTALSAPAIKSVRASSRAVQCSAQLRQLWFAASAYADEHGAYPIATRAESNNGVYELHHWDWVTTFDGTILRPGALYQYADRPDEVFQCPSYDGAPNGKDPATGYNYNTTYIGGEGPHVIPGWSHVRHGARPEECRKLAQCAIFGCAGRHGGTNKFMRAPENTVEGNLSQVYAGAQAFRHRLGTNVATLDGRIKRYDHPHKGVHATSSLLYDVMSYPENGFLSDDDSAYRPW